MRGEGERRDGGEGGGEVKRDEREGGGGGKGDGKGRSEELEE
mgnify:CR=1 FL=1